MSKPLSRPYDMLTRCTLVYICNPRIANYIQCQIVWQPLVWDNHLTFSVGQPATCNMMFAHIPNIVCFYCVIYMFKYEPVFLYLIYYYQDCCFGYKMKPAECTFNYCTPNALATMNERLYRVTAIVYCAVAQFTSWQLRNKGQLFIIQCLNASTITEQH